jgi:hypothetical protein
MDTIETRTVAAGAGGLAAVIPVALRSRADAVMLAVYHTATQLGANPPGVDATPAEALRHYGNDRDAWQRWMAWRAIALFIPEWQAFVAAQMPASGERARTMNAGSVQAPAAEEPECLGCQ